MTSDVVGGAARLSVVLAMAAEAAAAVAAATPRRATVWSMVATQKADACGEGTHSRLEIPVKRHRGEPGLARDRHTNRTNRTPSKPTHPPTRARQTTPKPRQSTPKPRDARVASSPQTAPHTPSSEVVVTDMATAPRRGSGNGEGASLTASVARHSSGDTGKKTPGGAGTHTEIPVKRHRGEPGLTRDGQTNHTKSQTEPPQNQPTYPPTDSRARPHPNRARPHPNPGTHASPQTAPPVETRHDVI